jgi:hypothetical protein
MLSCPFPKCRSGRRHDQFACLNHWRKMHLKNQALIWAAWNCAKSGLIDQSTLDFIQQKVMAYEAERQTPKEES